VDVTRSRLLSPLDGDFDEFVAVNSQELLRVAFLLVGDRGHAEDLVQTTLFRTARRWGAAKSNPRHYARRVLTNLAKDSWRDRRRRPVETAAPAHLDVGHGGLEEDVALRDQLLRATRLLPPRQRAVLVLRYFADLTVDDVAETLGCSPGTVKSQTHHALARLREVLAQEATNPEEFHHADR
jgi:RNA polymerase sigma-70 factor (sigma-E family)